MKQDKIGASYLIDMGGGAFKLNNPGHGVDIFGYDLAFEGQDRLNLGAFRFFRHSKSAHSHTDNDQTDIVGGIWKMNAGSISWNSIGSSSLKVGQSMSTNATDSIFETISGLIPGAAFGHARKCTALNGRINFEVTNSILNGGIELWLGPQGLSSKIEILPHGIELITNTGVDGIRANSLLGDVTLETLGGSIKETSLLSAFELDKTGQAQMQGLLGEVSIKSSGKPDNIVNKILEGKMKKYFSEITLLNQQYILDQEKNVKDIIEEFKSQNGNFKIVIKDFKICFSTIYSINSIKKAFIKYQIARYYEVSP